MSRDPLEIPTWFKVWVAFCILIALAVIGFYVWMAWGAIHVLPESLGRAFDVAVRAFNEEVAR